jgi:hypothetical protein
MPRSIEIKPKKRGRGRPYTGGRDPFVGIRLPADIILAIDQLAKDNAISRSAAIRQLVEQALAIRTEGKPAKEPIAPAAERDRELERQMAKNRYLQKPAKAALGK